MKIEISDKCKKMNGTNVSERIRGMAKELFFSYGLKSISIDDLARLSGISKRTVYQYYQDKDALVHAVVMDHIQLHERFLSSAQSTASEPIGDVIMRDINLFGLWTDIHHSFFYELEKYYPGVWQELEYYSLKMLNLIIDNLEWGKREGLYRNDINVVLIAELYMHQHRSLLKSQVETTQKLSKDCLVKEITMLYLRSIATERGKMLLENYIKEQNEHDGFLAKLK